ncbi:MAG: CsgG/HfaB family protein [Pseudomonadota bacterium]
MFKALRAAATALALLALPSGPASAAASVEDALTEIAQTIIGSLPEGEAPTLAISTFTHAGNTCSDLSNYASEIMLPTVQRVGGPSLRIYARSQLSAIFRELKLVYDGTISPNAAQQIGQISGVEAILTATIVPFGENIMVIGTLIATADGGVLGSANADFPITQTVQGLLANQSAAVCGFTPSATANAAPAAAGQPQAAAPSDRPSPAGDTLFTSDIFEAEVVNFFYASATGEATWAVRFRNTSDKPIALSYMNKSVDIADGLGGSMALSGGVSGLRTCSTNMVYCNGSSPQYATTLPPSGFAQMNFSTAGTKDLTDPIMTLTFEMVVTPDIANVERFDVRSIGYFDLQPVVK